ncbi:MAG: hypothetical protein ACPLN0_04595 [Candidatus Hydrothermia bacterium]
MRIDLFIKLTGLSRSRSSVKNWEIKVNGSAKKPSYEVKVGDLVEISDGKGMSLSFQILALPQGPVPRKMREKHIKIVELKREKVEKDYFLKWLFENF